MFFLGHFFLPMGVFLPVFGLPFWEMLEMGLGIVSSAEQSGARRGGEKEGIGQQLSPLMA